MDQGISEEKVKWGAILNSKLMSIFFRSERVGKNGRVFTMFKIKTLKEGVGAYAHEREYVPLGRFMRKYRIDELPQLFNIFRGEMAIFGPRPREAKEINLYPEEVKNKLLSVRPGLFSLSGIYFMNEEHILKLGSDANKDYYEAILPMKMTLDMFFIDNRSWLLYIALLWMALKARIFS